uniref:Endonuclease/exonuclease/phosphatase domain-containing protein n=1 Tax=Salarias fasciatus TaxID=181472 RepID=A0A672H1Y9_SALFA
MRTRLLLRSYKDRTALNKGPRTPYSRSTPHKTPRGTRISSRPTDSPPPWPPRTPPRPEFLPPTLISRRLNFSTESSIIDPEGRFVIITLSMKNVKFCIANVYGPNVDDPAFFHSLFSSLDDHSGHTLIIGGDFNMVSDPQLDRLSTTGSQRLWQSSETVKRYMKDFGICDAWRSHHPTAREYTFFSSVHHSYSRLDYFLTSSTLMNDISEIKIHPIVISDHAPVSFTLRNKKNKPPTRNWRFNTSLLKDPEFISYLTREWSIYLENNDLPDTSGRVLWEAGKAVMRGKIISFSSHKKKKEASRTLELELRIKSLEEAYHVPPQENILKDIRKVKLELNEILDKKTQFLIQRLRLENFESQNNQQSPIQENRKDNPSHNTS